ncbi:MAG: alpha-amylase [Anaerolineae bacterium]|nr:alpha-amylase [Anaerolineae bacterium]
MREFHISRQARDRYQFDQSLFALNGNIIFANFHAARLFAQKINQTFDLVNYPEKAIKAGQVNAMGLIDEILHLVISLYLRQKNPNGMYQAYQFISDKIGQNKLEDALNAFCQDFPPLSVYRKEMSITEYLNTSSEGVSNRTLALEEMLMLWVGNLNPALNPYLFLFDDQRLRSDTGYLAVMKELYAYFATQPPFGPDQQNLVDMLRSPAVAVPHSLSGQLEYIRTRWADLLGHYLYRLLSSMDLIREEEKLPFLGAGPVPIPVYDRSQAELEAERFSADRDWMPHLVLMAKNTYVWLDQLSRKYERPITHLDHIPDEELQNLAQQGFNGLWLIGLWERSQASARIKQLCGNPEAISSAYSLAGYWIADDLGGEEAYQNLRDRAARFGIRLASDMVPNHMGIDSQWVVEHPERFISLDYSPYPSYTFNGPNLSNDGRADIYLEDHYYNRSDAAVVFKRVDHSNGATQYIYHGNDGTSMPWNDTAQLNYLNPEVREAIIQTILDVARRFPIIRFDAAMTLAKRHYQRLWYPEPGSGGAIPSRSEHSIPRDQFEAAIPVEFWREVVDRAAREAPDTLLLAEAFWLMEGYFVRPLGMHRVYNSAFMNLLRDEDNAKYRTVMKNTLEFDPEILKRYVNFMNNPDERTAVDQFGKGDKYFGICLLMVTMPGLPMFGHGQIEGFAEKYGMEFRKAYWDENSDPYLLDRHQREIFPLLHRRAIFSGVENFLLYDFFTQHGSVNEDVFVYSNGVGSTRALVVYHNKFGDTSGWIRTSVGYLDKGSRQMVQRSLKDGLNLTGKPGSFVIFKDIVHQLEFIRPAQDLAEQGLYIQLGAYKYHVFSDFREVNDDSFQSYRRLCEYLGDRGVPSIEEALKELLLQPIQNPFWQIANSGYFGYLYAIRPASATTTLPAHLLVECEEKMQALLHGIESFNGPLAARDTVIKTTVLELENLLYLNHIDSRFALPGGVNTRQAVDYLKSRLDKQDTWLVLFGWLFTHNLGKLAGVVDFEDVSLSWLEEWQLSRILASVYRQMGLDEAGSWRLVSTVKLLISQQRWFEKSAKTPLSVTLENWLSNGNMQNFLNLNRYQDILWFNQECFDQMLWWLNLAAVLNVAGREEASAAHVYETLLGASQVIEKLRKAEKVSEFQVQKLLQAISLNDGA